MEGDFIVEVSGGENSSNTLASTRRVGQTVNQSQQDALTGLLGNYDIVDYKTLAASQREQRVSRYHLAPRVKVTYEEDPFYSLGISGYCLAQEFQAAVRVDASQRFTRLDFPDDLEEGIYNVRVALNLTRLNMDRIESISFTEAEYNSCDSDTEIFTKKELVDLSTESQSKTLVLGLHRQRHKYSGGSTYVAMDIRTLPSASKDDAGYIELHYVELHAFQSDTVVDSNTVFRPHEPYAWTIDVGLKDDPTDPRAPAIPAKIISYMMSGDGGYIATLSTRNTSLQLDIWESPIVAQVDGVSMPSTIRKFPQPPPVQYQTSISKNVEFGRVRSYTLPGGGGCFAKTVYNPPPLRVSISFDASKVVLMDGSGDYLTETFQAFSFQEAVSLAEKEKTFQHKRLSRIKDNELGTQLKNFLGYGKFHFTSAKDRDIEDELFIACDGIRVDIYSVHDRWRLIRKITLTTNEPIANPKLLIEGLAGKYFSWSDENNNLSVCDLETGRLVQSTSLTANSAHFSADGSLMVCHQSPNIITTRWTGSGATLGSTEIFDPEYCTALPAFTNDGSHVIVPSVQRDTNYGLGKLGMIMETTTLSMTEGVPYSTHLMDQQPQTAGSGGQYLFSQHGSKLSLLDLQNATIPPYPRTKLLCSDECATERSRLKDPEIIHPTSDLTTMVYAPNPDLAITVEFRETRTFKNTIVVSTSNGRCTPRVVLRIPPIVIESKPREVADFSFYVDKENQLLITGCRAYFMVWDLPASFEEKPTLRLAWCIGEFVDKDGVIATEMYRLQMIACAHGQPFAFHSCISPFFNLHEADTFSSSPDCFFDGLFALIFMFETGDEDFQEAVLQYVGRYINRSVDTGETTQTVLTVICNHVSQLNYGIYGSFLKALLDSPHGRWVPRPDLAREMNPISILLATAQSVPRVIGVTQVVIDYCIRMAKEEQDQRFVSPILDSLQELIELQEMFPDQVLSTLQRLVFIPAKDRHHVVDRAIIAHPPGLLSSIWRTKKSFYECEDPVLHLDLSPLPRKHDPKNESLTRDIFVASFNMLWRAPEPEPDNRSSVERIKDTGRPLLSWASIFFYMFWPSTLTKSNNKVDFYSFTPEMMDNPAIAALIEYKWNTIGYSYWLARFLWQCLFYSLVLVAVFIQVYDIEAAQSLTGVFIAIIAMASIFLLLELQQVFRNPSQYLSSPYNFVDIIAFALPLAGSACQIVNIAKGDSLGNISTLSFSVLFIFLHFVFELRVNRNMCHFVTIIVRIIGEIRVFFFVLAGGILAFTIAILHLLRGCPVGECNKDVKFPYPFHLALSSTYFFMGGIWDPVGDHFEEDDVAFHMMMVLYFFFTTILLLNVLIALINVAFSVADENWVLVWTENRLRFIEVAETLSYTIPGFRQAYDWFPKEIYYTATLQQQKDYLTKYPNKSKKNPILDGVSGGPRKQDSAGKAGSDSRSSTRMASESSAIDLDVVKQGQEELKELQKSQHEEHKQSLENLKYELKKELSGTKSSRSTDAGSASQGHEDLRRLQEAQHGEQKQSIEELKQELKQELELERQQSQLQMSTLQDQLRQQQVELHNQLEEQQRRFEKQMADMKEMLSAALSKA
ncbi:hypothetical protein BGX34_010552 [Mortierella sp. NVP85]|nr:hypothetical protein BGX34_010552 [Mortierella sp. NVP85]